MPEKPPEMHRNGRPKVPEFRPEERLYRRVSPDNWGDPRVEVDALDLPDMSVNRGKPIGEPGWVLLESDEYAHWGIIFFEVQNIPERVVHEGGSTYSFKAVHIPHDENYPHSEIWAFLGEVHVQARRELDPALSLRWRNALLQRTHTHRRPTE